MGVTGKYIAKYKVIRKIGQGGMADVYLALDPHLEREVAIKIIRTEMFPPIELKRVLNRFEHEAKALAKMDHPNIIHILDYGEFEGKPFLVMPHLPGGTLKDQLDGPIHWSQSLALLLPILKAVSYAHKVGLLHRDIKPSNILIRNDGTPILTDFGVAKVLTAQDPTLSITGAGIGTPNYMAPEQSAGKAEPASDQYALGMILYQMITGILPFNAETPLATMIKAAKDPLPPIRTYTKDIPPKVEDMISKMLMKDPADRFTDLGQVIARIELLIKGDQPAILLPPNPDSILADLDHENSTYDELNHDKTQGLTPRGKLFRSFLGKYNGFEITMIALIATITILIGSGAFLIVRGLNSHSTAPVAVDATEQPLINEVPSPFAKTHTPEPTANVDNTTQNVSIERNSIAAGTLMTVGIKADGTLEWSAIGPEFEPLADWKDMITVSAGMTDVIGLQADGTVKFLPTSLLIELVNEIESWEDIVRVEVNDFGAYGLRSDGTIANASINDTSTIFDTSTWYDITDISVGYDHIVGLRKDGTVLAVGTDTPEKFEARSWVDVISIATTMTQTFGLRSDGTVISTGKGQAGSLDTSYWKDIIAISANDFYVLGLHSDGTLEIETVILGVEDTGLIISNMIIDVLRWRDIVAIEAGPATIVGIRSDGTVVGTGNNEFWQLNSIGDWVLRVP